MICSGCGADIKRTDGWLRFARERELYMGDHGERVTEAAAVACSWICLRSVAFMLRVADAERPDAEVSS